MIGPAIAAMIVSMRGTTFVMIVAPLAGARSARADDKVLAKVTQPCADGAEYQALVLPGVDGAAGATSVTWAQQALDDGTDPPTSQAGKDTHGEAAYDQWWCVAPVTVTIDGKPRDLVVSTLGTFEGEGEAVAVVTMWSAPMDDAAATKAAAAGTLAAPDEVPATDDPDGAVAVIRDLLAKGKLATIAHPKFVLVGSAAGQVWQGAKAKKLLGSWKLTFEMDASAAAGAYAPDGGKVAWVLANVKATPKKGGAAITYRVLFGLVAGKPKKGKPTWKLVLAHFALPG